MLYSQVVNKFPVVQISQSVLLFARTSNHIALAILASTMYQRFASFKPPAALSLKASSIILFTRLSCPLNPLMGDFNQTTLLLYAFPKSPFGGSRGREKFDIIKYTIAN